MNKFFKVVLGVLATIVLGAVGSGLWERMLGPFLDWLTRSTIGLYASAVGTYRDSIYENAAKGLHEEHSLVVHTLIIAMIPLLYYFLLRRHPTETRDPNDPIRLFMRSRKGYWVIMFLTIIVFFGTVFTSLRIRHINETITYSLASIEIVRPFVGEQKYADLRSRYFAMRTTSDFRAIYEEVVTTAKENHRKLPEYEPL
jgi:hypothetical protein